MKKWERFVEALNAFGLPIVVSLIYRWVFSAVVLPTHRNRKPRLLENFAAKIFLCLFGLPNRNHRNNFLKILFQSLKKLNWVCLDGNFDVEGDKITYILEWGELEQKHL